jgi:hypothetical protein
MQNLNSKFTLRKIYHQARATHSLVRVYFRAAKRSLTIKQKDSLARISATLLSLLFFNYFPYIVLASYMSWSGFFSYDMFTEGVSGAKAFYWWTEGILIIGALYMAGSLYFIIESKVKNGSYWPKSSAEFWLLLMVNILMLGTIFCSPWTQVDGFKKIYFLGTLLICIWIIFHIAIVVNCSGKAAFKSLFYGAVGLITISFLVPGALAMPYSRALQYFGNGGKIHATVWLKNNHATIHGKLVIQSPKHIYIYPDGSNSITVIAQNDIEKISTDNLSGFGHKE